MSDKKPTKKEKEFNKLKDQFDEIQGEGSEFDFSQHLAQLEDLPDLGEIEIYDYDSDLTTSSGIGNEVLTSLVDLYLGDIPKLKEHPYIKNKMKEDATVYSESIFLSKMTRKNLLNQMRQIDNGDNSARMYEVANQTIKEIRENSKFLSTQRTDLEKYWKELRNDLGYEEINTYQNSTINEVDDDENINDDGSSKIMNQRDLNDMIRKAMAKESDKKNKDK